LVDQTRASWNQLASWLRRLYRIRAGLGGCWDDRLPRGRFPRVAAGQRPSFPFRL